MMSDSKVYVNPEATTRLLEKLNEQRLQTKECDFLLTNGTRSQNVHRCLARLSSRAIDETVDKDPACKQFHIPNISDNSLDALVQYFYTSELVVDSETALDLYGAAETLKIDFVAESCLDYLSSTVTVENCVDCLIFSVNRHWTTMKRELIEFCVQNFEDLIPTETYLKIPPMEFMEILADPGLYISDELSLFNAMHRWCKYDWATREQYATRLSENVRYQLIQVSSLLDMLTASENHFFAGHIRQALVDVGHLAEDSVHSKWDRKPKQTENHKSRKPAVLEESPQGNSLDVPEVNTATEMHVIALIGGRSQEKKLLKDIVCFQISSTGNLVVNPANTSPPLSLHPLSIGSLKRMPCPRKGFGALVIRNNLFVIGGKSSGSMQTVDVYDAQNDRWLMGPPLLVERSWHGVTECNGNIYVVGGCNAAGETLDHCEMLDTRTGVWQIVPSAPHPRMSHGVASCGTLVFSVGGLGEKSVEWFDTVAGKWHGMEGLQDEHEAPGVICHDRYLYVFGGAGKHGSMTCVERYDIEQQRWEPMASMPEARAFSATTHYEDYVFLIGGRSNTEFSQLVQLYDLNRNRWYILPQQLPAARSSSCAVVLHWKSHNLMAQSTS